MEFRYAPALLHDYAHICGGILHGVGLRNGPAPAELTAAYRAEQAAVAARVAASASEIPSLAAWRQSFRRFGVNPTKVRSAAEALLRRLDKKGDIPSINTLVDIGNLVSIRYALPVALFDLRGASGGATGAITVRAATGDERFRELDSVEVSHPEPGEVIFVDEQGTVIARRWCWRQSAESAAREDTTEVLVTVEAQHVGGRADVVAAVTDLRRLLETYAGGEYTGAILDAEHPSFMGMGIRPLSS